MTKNNIFLKIFFIVLTSLSSLVVKAEILTVVHDAETEKVINEIASPVFKAAHLFNPRIYLIQNNTPNAYTAGGEEIYIHTGLITKFPNPDILRGVIAHEVGHIMGKHAVRHEVTLHDTNKISLSTVMLGMVTALASNNPAAVIHSTVVGQHAAERLQLSYARSFEASADQTAVDLLEKSGHSACGLLELFRYYTHNQPVKEISAYDSTHPMSENRIGFIKAHLAKSSFLDSKNSEDLNKRYERVSAKLLAFTTNKPNLKVYSSTARKYGETILQMKKSNKELAIKSINTLIKKSPRDPYYHELKGQILMHFGDHTALKEYGIAYEISNDPLLKLEYAIALALFSNDPNIIKDSIGALDSIVAHDCNNLTALEFLSIAYDKLNYKGESLYYRAKIAQKSGDLQQARKLAATAQKLLSRSSSFWLKADDIIRTEL